MCNVLYLKSLHNTLFNTAGANEKSESEILLCIKLEQILMDFN